MIVVLQDKAQITGMPGDRGLDMGFPMSPQSLALGCE
jgi:hypothetical protein